MDKPSFTEDQINRLIALNRHLAELEYWCVQRARSMVEDYKKLAGPAWEGCEGEDLELESSVEYYRQLTIGEEQDTENSHDGLILATSFVTMPPLKWYFLNPTQEHATHIYKHFYRNWYDRTEYIEAFKNQRICFAFHDLHDHHGLSWDQILTIETVWVDVKAIHQLATLIGRNMPGMAGHAGGRR